MALAKVLSCAVVGLDGELVEVEVDVAQGVLAFAIVGLPIPGKETDSTVAHCKKRLDHATRRLH